VLLMQAGCWGPQNIAQGLQSERAGDQIAACRAAGRQRDESVLPLLVDRLLSPSADVRFFAIDALEKIAGRRFEYRYYAPAEERSRSIEAVRRWLRQRAAKEQAG
jgi:HEAT repeat protein